MGCNIHIASPGWDSGANAGAKEIMSADEKFPKTTKPDYDFWEGEFPDFRPSDFDLWRKSIKELGFNVEMWLRALDFLERNPEEWVSWSR